MYQKKGSKCKNNFLKLVKDFPNWQEYIKDEALKNMTIQWLGGKSFEEIGKEHFVTASCIRNYIIGNKKHHKGSVMARLIYRKRRLGLNKVSLIFSLSAK